MESRRRVAVAGLMGGDSKGFGMEKDNAQKPAEERDIQSVRRALEILEAVSAGGELGVTDIARQVGLHVATTHNLLRTLSRYDYLENRGGRYRIGAAVGMLSAGNADLQGLPELLRPWMQRISRECGEAASSSVICGRVLRILAFEPGTQLITTHLPQWVWPQPLSLATGRALVGALPTQEWEDYIIDGGAGALGRTPQEWREELEQVRAQGYCRLVHAGNGGQMALGFPVRARTGRTIFAVGATATTFRETPEVCVALFESVRQVAAELSEQFGAPADEVARLKGIPPPRWDKWLAGGR